MSLNLFQPVEPDAGETVTFLFDGAVFEARASDTILAALLRQGARTGRSEFDGTPRAGFCLMGSCQECTVWDGSGRRLRACMEEIRAGLSLHSAPCADVRRDG